MKKAIFSIVSIVFILSVLLITFTFNSLVTIQKPHSIIQYKVAFVEFDSTAQGTANTEYLSFPYKDYLIVSEKSLSEMSNIVGENFQPFIMKRINVYNERGPFFDGGFPVLIDIRVTSQQSNIYSWRAEGYYIPFDTETFAKNSIYVLEYQDFMNEYEPTLQKPIFPNFTLPDVDGIDDIVPLVKEIFTNLFEFYSYIGDSVLYFFQRLEYYSNYVVFYIEYYSPIFKFN